MYPLPNPRIGSAVAPPPGALNVQAVRNFYPASHISVVVASVAVDTQIQMQLPARLLVRKRSTEHLSHFCQRSGGYGIYATRLSMV